MKKTIEDMLYLLPAEIEARIHNDYKETFRLVIYKNAIGSNHKQEQYKVFYWWPDYSLHTTYHDDLWEAVWLMLKWVDKNNLS